MPTSNSRNTAQRRAVLAMLAELVDFNSAQQIHHELQKRGQSVGLSTVYRNLSLLVELGEVDSQLMPDGETVFRKCSTKHHHHLTCRKCGLAVEIAAEAVEQWTSRIAKRHHFSAVDHTLELIGLCEDCG